jgi:hypothetical protein
MFTVSSWRPPTGWEIGLSDRTLAKIGFLAMCDEQARQITLACLKSVKGLSADEWRAEQSRKFFQITKDLLRLTPSLDSELNRRVDRLERKRLVAQDLRQRFVHSVWGHGPAENQQVSYDYKRSALSTQSELLQAIDEMSHLTLLARRCLERTADLICEGKLTGGSLEGSGLKFRVRDRWIAF